MSDNNNKAWNTKYGPRRVRNEAPTLEEAISAAKDLSDEPEAQAEIAASLMGVPVEQVAAELAKMAPERKNVQTVSFSSRSGVQRAVVVERKPVRRLASVDRSAVLKKFGSAR